MLGTPPAFILSQDRTLVKIVDLGSDERQLSLVLSFPYLLLRFGSHLKFSFLQNHLPASLRLQEAPLRGVCSFQNLPAHASMAVIFETCAFFCRFRTFGFCMCFTVQFSKNCLFCCHSRDSLFILPNLCGVVNNFFKSFFDLKKKRRRRDLNPRFAFANYTLSRGASSAS